MTPETDLIEKLNQPYVLQSDAYNASNLLPGDLVQDANLGITCAAGINGTHTAINTVSVEYSTTMNLDDGIRIDGEVYTKDDIRELFELKEILKQLHPELFLIN